jgi:hypothetical protein
MGGDGNGSSPLGIIPKNLVQLVTSMEAFGVDIPGILNSLLAKTIPKTSGNGSGNSSTKSLPPAINLLKEALSSSTGSDDKDSGNSGNSKINKSLVKSKKNSRKKKIPA